MSKLRNSTGTMHKISTKLNQLISRIEKTTDIHSLVSPRVLQYENLWNNQPGVYRGKMLCPMSRMTDRHTRLSQAGKKANVAPVFRTQDVRRANHSATQTWRCRRS